MGNQDCLIKKKLIKLFFGTLAWCCRIRKFKPYKKTGPFIYLGKIKIEKNFDQTSGSYGGVKGVSLCWHTNRFLSMFP